MKASDFVNLMRKVIRDEVRTIVREELKTIKPLLKETAQPGLNASLRQALPAKTPKVVAPKRKPSVDPITFKGPLGDLLNETYQSMVAQPQEEDEWPDMNGGQPMSSQMFAGMEAGDAMSLSSVMDDDSPLPDLGGGYGDPTSAFIKDYSSVMKAADAIQGKG